MTDDLERLEALAREGLRDMDAICDDGQRYGVRTGVAILSLIQRVREADAWREDASGKLIELAKALVTAHDAGSAAGRAEALEEAAKVAEGTPHPFGASNPYVFEMREALAAALRALKDKSNAP